MPPTPPDTAVATAAELRAGGLSWEAVAARLGKSARTVRRWSLQYPDRWRRHLAAAEEQLLAEATAESVHTLRGQLRSEDDKARRDAADKLIRFRVAAAKKARPERKRPAEPRPSASAVRTAAYLEGLSDVQLHDLIETLWDQRQRRLAAARDGERPGQREDPAGPARPE